MFRKNTHSRFLIDVELIRTKLLKDQKEQITSILSEFFITKNKELAISKLDLTRQIVMNLYVQLTGNASL